MYSNWPAITLSSQCKNKAIYDVCWGWVANTHRNLSWLSIQWYVLYTAHYSLPFATCGGEYFRRWQQIIFDILEMVPTAFPLLSNTVIITTSPPLPLFSSKRVQGRRRSQIRPQPKSDEVYLRIYVARFAGMLPIFSFRKISCEGIDFELNI